MSTDKYSSMIAEIAKCQEMVKSYLFRDDKRIKFSYKPLEDAVYSYINAGGKSLRSAVLMFICGAVGGDITKAIPAAAAIELYHTFTLVHDDIIDHDEMRRGVPTVHYEFAHRAASELGFDTTTAEHYGLAIAILAGDMQQGWAASILPDLHHEYNLSPVLVLNLITNLFKKTQIALINGETVDILQSKTPVENVTEDEVLEMLWQKTGALYEFAGRAGAAIGLNQPDLSHYMVNSLAQFASNCGTAFQIQDDILGILGDEKRIGKPVGSDIREGKRTIIVLHSLPKMSVSERNFTLSILGNNDATRNEIEEVKDLLQQYGGIAHAKNKAQDYIQKALPNLDILDASIYKNHLRTWADYILERDL